MLTGVEGHLTPMYPTSGRGRSSWQHPEVLRSLGHRRLAIFAACATLVLAALVTATFPIEAPLPAGWHTPIIAFELARTPEDLAWLAGAEAEELREAMRAGHRIDMVFPLAYGALLVASCGGVRGRLAKAAAAFGGLAIPLDWLENAALEAITDALERGGDGARELGLLLPATWGKWGAIGCALALLGLAIRSDEPRTGHALVLSACTVPVAALTGAPLAGELMSVAVSVAFVLLVVRAFRR